MKGTRGREHDILQRAMYSLTLLIDVMIQTRERPGFLSSVRLLRLENLLRLDSDAFHTSLPVFTHHVLHDRSVSTKLTDPTPARGIFTVVLSARPYLCYTLGTFFQNG